MSSIRNAFSPSGRIGFPFIGRNGSSIVGAEDERTGSRSQIIDEFPPKGTPRRRRPHLGTSRTAAISGRAGIGEAPGRTATEPNQTKRIKQLLRRPIGRGRKCPRKWTLPGRHTPPVEKLAQIPTPSPLAKTKKRRKCSLQQYDFSGEYLGAHSQSSHSYLLQEQKSIPLLYIPSPALANANGEERDCETRGFFFGRLTKSALFFFPLPSARTPAQLGYTVCL